MALLRPRNNISIRDQAGDDGKRTTLKRGLAQSEEVGGIDKRLRTDISGASSAASPFVPLSLSSAPVATGAANVLQNFDFSTLPLNIVIELAIGVLQEIGQVTLDKIVASARQGQTAYPLSTSASPVPPPTALQILPTKRDPRLRRDPRLPPASETLSTPLLQLPSNVDHIGSMSFDAVKEELVLDPYAFGKMTLHSAPAESQDIKPWVDTPSRTTALIRQESPPPTDRATQMRAFALKSPPRLMSSEARETLKQVVHRIFAAEESISAGAFASAANGTAGALTSRKTTLMTKNSWMLILSRLGTRSFVEKGILLDAAAPEKEEKMDMEDAGEELAGADEMRQMIVDFVDDDFRNR